MELWRSSEGKTKAEEPAGPAAVITIPEEDSAAAKEVSASMEDLFARAVAAGLTSEAAVITMRNNITGGYFSEQHYRDMWSKRLGDHANTEVAASQAVQGYSNPSELKGKWTIKWTNGRTATTEVSSSLFFEVFGTEYEILFGGAVPKFTWPDGTLQTLKRLTTRSNGAKELMWAVHHGSHIEHIYWEQEAPSSARHTPRRLSVAFVDTDGDSIVFKRTGDGTVDYWVNGELEIVSISKIFCNRDTGRLQVMQFGRDGACVTTPKERSDSEAVMELWRSSEGKSEEAPATGFEARARRLQKQEDEQKSEEGRRKLLELSNLLADRHVWTFRWEDGKTEQVEVNGGLFELHGNSYPGYSIRVNDSPISFDGPNGAKPTVEFWDGRTITWSGHSSWHWERDTVPRYWDLDQTATAAAATAAATEALGWRISEIEAESIDDFLARSPTLDEIFARCIAAGLFTENSKQLKIMRENIDAGKFSEEHYRKMWTKRLNEHYGRKKSRLGSLVNSTGLAEKVAPPIEEPECMSEYRIMQMFVLFCMLAVFGAFGGGLLSFDYQADCSSEVPVFVQSLGWALVAAGALSCLLAVALACTPHTEMEEFDEIQDGEMIFVAMFFGCMEALGIRGVVGQPAGRTKLTVILGIWFLLVLLIPALYYLFFHLNAEVWGNSPYPYNETNPSAWDQPGWSPRNDPLCTKRGRCSSASGNCWYECPDFKCRPYGFSWRCYTYDGVDMNSSGLNATILNAGCDPDLWGAARIYLIVSWAACGPCIAGGFCICCCACLQMLAKDDKE